MNDSNTEKNTPKKEEVVAHIIPTVDGCDYICNCPRDKDIPFPYPFVWGHTVLRPVNICQCKEPRKQWKLECVLANHRDNKRVCGWSSGSQRTLSRCRILFKKHCKREHNKDLPSVSDGLKEYKYVKGVFSKIKWNENLKMYPSYTLRRKKKNVQRVSRRQIHSDAVIEDGATMKEGVSIGSGCEIQSGSIVGKGLIICSGAKVGNITFN